MCDSLNNKSYKTSPQGGLMSTIPLKCQCGAVTGIVKNVTPKYGSRLVCHCSDCQAFANHIGAGDQSLDPYGGTEIYQTNPAQISFETGSEHMKCLRLTPKGTIRWYTGCCSTPIGNTISGKVPFVGLIHTIIGAGYDQAAGPVSCHVQTQDALPGLAPDLENEGFPKAVTRRVIGKMLRWKLTGKARPNPFFDKDGRAVAKPEIINA